MERRDFLTKVSVAGLLPVAETLPHEDGVDAWELRLGAEITKVLLHDTLHEVLLPVLGTYREALLRKGYRLPLCRIRDDQRLPERAYQVLVRGRVFGTGVLMGSFENFPARARVTYELFGELQKHGPLERVVK